MDPSVLATTSTLTPAHTPTRATTQGPSCSSAIPSPQLKESHYGPQPIECHVLNPYPEPQLKDTFRLQPLEHQQAH